MTALSRVLREGEMSSTMVVGMPVRKPVSTVAMTAWIWPQVDRTQEGTFSRRTKKGGRVTDSPKRYTYR